MCACLMLMMIACGQANRHLRQPTTPPRDCPCITIGGCDRLLRYSFVTAVTPLAASNWSCKRSGHQTSWLVSIVYIRCAWSWCRCCWAALMKPLSEIKIKLPAACKNSISRNHSSLRCGPLPRRNLKSSNQITSNQLRSNPMFGASASESNLIQTNRIESVTRQVSQFFHAGIDYDVCC